MGPRLVSARHWTCSDSMTTVVITPTARDDLETLIRSHSLPVERSLATALDRVAIATIQDARSSRAATTPCVRNAGRSQRIDLTQECATVDSQVTIEQFRRSRRRGGSLA